MSATVNLKADLRRVLKLWTEITQEHQADERAFYRSHGGKITKAAERSSRVITQRMARRARPHLNALLQDNSTKTAEELEALAGYLSPGGAHNGGLLIRLVRANMWFADPILVAAVVRYNWHGGKAGFQFLPDPANTDPGEYESEAYELMDLLHEATDGDPRRILTGEDRDFFDSLPDSFTVYRGCAGVSPEVAAAGVCWTTRREIAEWFAVRSVREDGKPVTVTARIKKREVRLAQASEFEIVCSPRRARPITWRHRDLGSRPDMSWKRAPAPEPNPAILYPDSPTMAARGG